MKKKITIQLNGKDTAAFEGDTVLASLVAGGYKNLRKSRKLNENRGAVCGMGVCYECLVTINGVPGRRACMTEIEAAMTVETDES